MNNQTSPTDDAASAIQPGHPSRLVAILKTPLVPSLGPIPLFFRHRGIRARLDAAVEATDITPTVASHIDAITRRTRLRQHERHDVCRELIAHARDASLSGQPEHAVLASLGDPKPVARLLRRAVRRKRSPLYHARVALTRALAAVFAVALLAYAALTVRFLTGTPTITTDYFAKLNAHHDHLPADQRAWPVYEAAWLEWKAVELALLDQTAYQPLRPDLTEAEQASMDAMKSAGVHRLPDLPDDHPDTPAVRDAILAFRPTLDRVAAAAKLPAIGYPYSNRSEHTGPVIPMPGSDPTLPEQRRMRPLPYERTSPLADDSVIGVLLPQLGDMRTAARLLAADAQLAANAGDAELAASRIHAILDIASQSGREPFIISQLVAQAVHALATGTIDTLLADQPDLWSDDQLAALAHALHASSTIASRVDFTAERMMFDDILQRVYTDDGNGDGHLTLTGLRSMKTLGSLSGETGGDILPDYPFAFALAPAAQFVTGSRADNDAAYTTLLTAAQDLLARGPAALPDYARATASLQRAVGPSTLARLMAPSFERFITSSVLTRARTDATNAAIAVHLSRRQHNALPATLTDLVPALLPALPPDPFNPGHPLRYLAHPDGSFTIYSVGADADDDRGTPPAATLPPSDPASRAAVTAASAVRDFAARFPADPAATDAESSPPVDGDWVLYPPAD